MSRHMNSVNRLEKIHRDLTYFPFLQFYFSGSREDASVFSRLVPFAYRQRCLWIQVSYLTTC